MYLHATLTPKVGKVAELSDMVARLAAAMQGPGMKLLGAYQTALGAPGRIVDIWEIEDANTIVGALEGAATHPMHQATMDRLGQSLVREELRLVERASYGREFVPGSSPDARYMHAKLTIKYGQLARISDVIERLRDVLEAELGWRLIGGYRTIIGDFGELFDLWELPEGRPLDDMLVEARSIPAFAEAARELPDYLEAEDVQLMRATAYCPL